MHIYDRIYLYLYSFVHNLPDDGLLEGETCMWDTIYEKLLFIIDGADCWSKYYI
jgi:hypothetical protein